MGEKIDLERIVDDVEYRSRVLRYLNGCSPLLSQKDIDVNRVIADAAYRREAVRLLNRPGGTCAEHKATKSTIVSWQLLRSLSAYSGDGETAHRCKADPPMK